MCEIKCGMNVYVEDGKVVKVAGMPEHRLNTLCVRGQHAIDWEYSPERLMYPLRREKNGWQRVSWDEAIGDIADRLKKIKAEYGAKALAICMGQAVVLEDTVYIVGRFGQALGTPNVTSSAANLCFFPSKELGNTLTFGCWARGHFRVSRCIVLWGSDPTYSNHYNSRMIRDAMVSGAMLLVVDPRCSTWAKRADIHVQLRPGTDCALALGLINVIINEKLYDEEIVERWSVGFDRLKEHIQQYPPEWAAKITQVPAELIVEFARAYAKIKPAAIWTGLALDGHANAVQTGRAISILIALTGNLDVRGGNLLSDKHPLANCLQLDELPPLEKSISDHAYPLYNEIARSRAPIANFSSWYPISEAILSGKPYPVKALIMQGGNSVITTPNAEEVRRSLKNLDLFVVMDHFLTETAELAHYVLPATTFLEQNKIPNYYPYLNHIVLSNKAVEPLGECRPDTEFWIDLARKLGLGKYFPWKNHDEVIEDILRHIGTSLKELKESPGGVFFGRKREYLAYQKEGFDTPSGKIEFYSERMAAHGYEPLPVYHEPPYSPISRPEVAAHYPLILGTGSRVPFYWHSRFRNIPSLRRRCPDPAAEISRETAQNLGIQDGDWIIIESPTGSVKMRAKLSDDLFPGSVWIPHGWGKEQNANRLVDDSIRDPISGTPDYRSLLCSVRKAEMK